MHWSKISRLLTDCRPSCWSIVDQVTDDQCWWSVDRVSTEYRSSIDRVSIEIEYWSWVNRHSTADAFSRHDPRWRLEQFKHNYKYKSPLFCCENMLDASLSTSAKTSIHIFGLLVLCCVKTNQSVLSAGKSFMLGQLPSQVIKRLKTSETPLLVLVLALPSIFR